MTIILEGISVFQIKSFLTADTRLFYEVFFYEACDIDRFCRSSLSVDRVLKESKIRTFFILSTQQFLTLRDLGLKPSCFSSLGPIVDFEPRKRGLG